jgi:hypothetical protein
MKNLFSLAIILTPLLFAGCSIFIGLDVNIRPEFSEVFKKEFIAFLSSRGFQPEGGQRDGFTAAYAMHPRIGQALREGLAAMFYSDGKEYWLHVGKSGTARFTQTEVSMVDECARFIASHADVIVSGNASARSTSAIARAEFYAKIKRWPNQPPLQTPTSGTPAAGAPVAPPSGAAGR